MFPSIENTNIHSDKRYIYIESIKLFGIVRNVHFELELINWKRHVRML